MKMKKIIALGVSAIMMLSSVIANAELAASDVGGGMYLVSAMPTQDEIRARQPKTAITVTQLKTQDEVLAATNVIFNMGTSVNDYNVFKLTWKITDLGGLTYAYDSQGALGAYVQLRNVLFALKGINPAKSNTLSKFNNVAWAANQVGEQFNLAYDVTSAGYPSAADAGSTGVYYPNAEMDEGSIIFAFNKEGATPVATLSTLVTYFDSASKNSSDNSNMTFTVNGEAATTITFAPESEEAKPIEFTATLKENVANGYIWGIKFTQSGDKLASFTANFVADDGKTADRAINNVAEFASALGGASAPFDFYLGLETTKTLTAATFTADDADPELAAWVVNADVQ